MSDTGAVPEPRTVTGEGKDAYADWEIELRADFSARNLADLMSGDAMLIMETANGLVIEHNFPGPDGTLAPSIMDAVPWDWALAVVNDALSNLSKLPNR